MAKMESKVNSLRDRKDVGLNEAVRAAMQKLIILRQACKDLEDEAIIREGIDFRQRYIKRPSSEPMSEKEARNVTLAVLGERVRLASLFFRQYPQPIGPKQAGKETL